MPARNVTLLVEGLEVKVTRKSVRTIRIVIEPPEGWVRVSAPHRVGDEEVRSAVRERLDWIHRHRKRMAAKGLPPRLDYVEGERLRWLGQELELLVKEGAKRNKARIRFEEGVAELSLREGSDRSAREKAVEACWRSGLEALLPAFARPWEERLGVSASTWAVRRMTSRWGSCNTKTGRICLNLELARRAPACLEYVIVHELAHLREAGHGPRFKAILDRAMPDWRAREKLLAAESLPRTRN